jgi:hypothetical protein
MDSPSNLDAAMQVEHNYLKAILKVIAATTTI